ncbi:ephrin type-A receptor 7 [Elysia marginata]|uniref:Ephrin type-A receptor 7 n=1 Tax=Elysia marginata TaxID=1093978 RepID=A0AAV4H9G2_9GAST|nr:ephrin type-A receptor 7 [Elysia marginata]
MSDGGVCQAKIPVGQFCTASGQCVVNAECEAPSGGLCVCNRGYFPTGDQGGACAAFKLPGDQCLAEDRCVKHAFCDQPADGTCVCEVAYYSTGLECLPRIKPDK